MALATFIEVSGLQKHYYRPANKQKPESKKSKDEGSASGGSAMMIDGAGDTVAHGQSTFIQAQKNTSAADSAEVPFHVDSKKDSLATGKVLPMEISGSGELKVPGKTRTSGKASQPEAGHENGKADETWQLAHDAHALAKLAPLLQTHTHSAWHIKHKVLYIIWTDLMKTDDARAHWGLRTWAKGVDRNQIAFIGDKRASAWLGRKVHQTKCQSRGEAGVGECCKYGEALALARFVMAREPSLEWVFFADDDAYIRHSALENALLRQPPASTPDHGIVLAGSFECKQFNCNGEICGGGGFAANRRAVALMVGNDPAGFVQGQKAEAKEEVHRCKECSLGSFSMADAGLRGVFAHEWIEQRLLPGVYPWLLDRGCFKKSLKAHHEPLMYHMMSDQKQFDSLYKLFDEPLIANFSHGNYVLEIKAKDKHAECVEFHGRALCSPNHLAFDKPWYNWYDDGSERRPCIATWSQWQNVDAKPWHRDPVLLVCGILQFWIVLLAVLVIFIRHRARKEDKADGDVDLNLG